MSIGEILILVALVVVIVRNFRKDNAAKGKSNPGNPPTPEELEAALESFKKWSKDWQDQHKQP